MVVIRMRRAGSKNRAFYRIVVTESAAAREGRFIEILGHYNPRTSPETLVFDRERVAQRARALGLVVGDVRDDKVLTELLCHDGLSTKEEASAQILDGLSEGEDVVIGTPSLAPRGAGPRSGGGNAGR